MDVYIRSRLTSGLVMAGVSALIAASTAPPQSTAPSAALPVALAAQVQPLQPLLTRSATSAAMTPAVIQPLNPVIQQVDFNIAFLGDFVSTGAVLFGREFAIPGALLQAVKNGTPVPAAVGQALQTFAQIELEAGRDLVGFAAEYVSFQVNFLTSLAAMPFAAVGASAASTATQTTPHEPTTAVTPANITTTAPAHTATLQLKTLRSVVPKPESATKTTPKTHHDGGQPKGGGKKG